MVFIDNRQSLTQFFASKKLGKPEKVSSRLSLYCINKAVPEMPYGWLSLLSLADCEVQGPLFRVGTNW